MPIASVIIPTFNRLPLLREAIASVLNQTLPDFELLVIDDGSTDGTGEDALGFADRRIRYFRLPHGGRSKARNHGIQAAQGQFITFLDDDDLYLPDKLESEIECFRRNPEIDLIASGAFVCDMESGEEVPSRPWLNQPEPDLHCILSQCRFLMCSVAIKRRFLLEAGCYFDEELHAAEDFDFFARLALAGCRMAWLEKLTSRYRLRAHSTWAPAIGHAMACIDAANRFFSRPDIPDSIRRQQNEILAERYLFCGFRAMAGGLDPLAAKCLTKAMALWPRFGQGEHPALLDRFAEFTDNEIGDAAPDFAESALTRLSAMLAENEANVGWRPQPKSIHHEDSKTRRKR